MNINDVKKLSGEKFIELHEEFYNEIVSEIIGMASKGYYIAKLKITENEIDKYISLAQKLKSDGYNCEIKTEEDIRNEHGFKLLEYVDYLIVDWTN